MQIISRLYQAYMAWRRKEKRVSAASRGRVYERLNSELPDNSVIAALNQKCVIISAKITRADGSIEHHYPE